eukprot:CFRG3030T1
MSTDQTMNEFQRRQTELEHENFQLKLRINDHEEASKVDYNSTEQVVHLQRELNKLRGDLEHTINENVNLRDELELALPVAHDKKGIQTDKIIALEAELKALREQNLQNDRSMILSSNQAESAKSSRNEEQAESFKRIVNSEKSNVHNLERPQDALYNDPSDKYTQRTNLESTPMRSQDCSSPLTSQGSISMDEQDKECAKLLAWVDGLTEERNLLQLQYDKAKMEVARVSMDNTTTDREQELERENRVLQKKLVIVEERKSRIQLDSNIKQEEDQKKINELNERLVALNIDREKWKKRTLDFERFSIACDSENNIIRETYEERLSDMEKEKNTLSDEIQVHAANVERLTEENRTLQVLLRHTQKEEQELDQVGNSTGNEFENMQNELDSVHAEAIAAIARAEQLSSTNDKNDDESGQNANMNSQHIPIIDSSGTDYEGLNVGNEVNGDTSRIEEVDDAVDEKFRMPACSLIKELKTKLIVFPKEQNILTRIIQQFREEFIRLQRRLWSASKRNDGLKEIVSGMSTTIDMQTFDLKKHVEKMCLLESKLQESEVQISTAGTSGQSNVNNTNRSCKTVTSTESNNQSTLNDEYYVIGRSQEAKEECDGLLVTHLKSQLQVIEEENKHLRRLLASEHAEGEESARTALLSTVHDRADCSGNDNIIRHLTSVKNSTDGRAKLTHVAMDMNQMLKSSKSTVGFGTCWHCDYNPTIGSLIRENKKLRNKIDRREKVIKDREIKILLLHSQVQTQMQVR